ncbi:ABC transporter substrate-binding protein/permease [Schleiferilactobacillus harbinensis]|uniref:ABC transporter substrate-binding protein/permease n=1 Tax=Schleiferilactobacillus harbinensis TaxID=304207 RepID=UPI00123A8BD6|nr:ABC transporter substrate-binding protein/permease [Schleiferilactobacillus harbinensis]QEU46488.1 ABC transporter substrate-binding protein/permease [Schleiferilactobacillus harbinensis]
MERKHWLIKVLAVLTMLLSLGAAVGQAQPAQAATNQSLAKIKQKGTLVMGTSPDYPPYEFLVNNQPVGMDVSIAKQIAKDLGVKLVVKQMDFDALLVGLETHKVDMVLSAMTPTPERKQSVDFSNVYYTSGQSIIINKTDKSIYKSYKNFANKNVGAQTGSLQYDLVKKQIKGAKITGLTKVTDLIIALKTHKIEGIAAESAVATAYVKNNPDLTVLDHQFNLSESDSGTAIAFAKGSTSLVAAVNQSLAKIKKQNLTEKYLSEAGKSLKVNVANTSMWHYRSYFIKGVGYTLLISLIAVLIGVVLGTLLALSRLSHFLPLKWIATAYVEFIRGTPLMIQVMFLYFGLNVPALTAGVAGVAMNSGAYVAEYIRGGIDSVPKGQVEAARSLGLSYKDTMRYVILPQALKIIWPSLGNEFISLIKESSIVSVIGVTDLIYQLRLVQAATYKGIAPYAVAMVIYFILVFGLTRLLNFAERKMQHA